MLVPELEPELELGLGLEHAGGCFGGREFDGVGGEARIGRPAGIDVDGRRRGWKGA